MKYTADSIVTKFFFVGSNSYYLKEKNLFKVCKILGNSIEFWKASYDGMSHIYGGKNLNERSTCFEWEMFQKYQLQCELAYENWI